MREWRVWAGVLIVLQTVLRGAAPAAPPAPADRIESYDVVWTTPSQDSLGSMPLGNGDVGLNAWVEENGDLWLYLSKVDAFDGGHILRKVGKTRIAITPNPFTAGKLFRQRLALQDGSVLIQGGQATAQVELRIWVDANRPVIHVDGQSGAPVQVRVSAEPTPTLHWRAQALAAASGEPVPDPTDQWVWSKEPRPKVYFKAVWPPAGLDKPAASGDDYRIVAKCDNIADVYVNAQKLGHSENWATGWNGAARLKPGDVITVDGTDTDSGDHSAGLFFQVLSRGGEVLLGARDLRYSLEAPAASWRTDADLRGLKIPDPQNVHPTHKAQAGGGGTDVLVTDAPEGLIWFHRNLTSMWRGHLARQGSPELAAKLPDPLLNLTFGGFLRAEGFTRPSANTLASPDGCRQFEITIDVLAAQTAAPAEWVAQIRGQAAANAKPGRQKAWQEHSQWWQAFWDRSHILVEGCGRNRIKLTGYRYSNRRETAADYWNSLEVDGDQNALTLTRGYLLERFQQACSSRGRMPPPYNGSIFNMDMPAGTFKFEGPRAAPTSADTRDWDGWPIMWQNTRLPAWSMPARGDYDLMGPVFQAVREGMEVSRDRCRAWFKHEGAFLTEAMSWKGPSAFYPLPGHLQFHFLASIEIPAMMCDYYEHTRDARFLQETLLPCADEFLLFYDKHYPRKDANGKRILAPAGVVETYQPVTNPVTEVSGLHRLLGQLLTFDERLVGQDRRQRWSKLLAEVPPVPMRTVNGLTLLAIGDRYSGRLICETPELYAVYPFRQAWLGSEPLLAAARQSFHVRQLSLDGTPDTQSWETGGWVQAPMQAAHLGLPRESARLVSLNFLDRFTPIADNPNMHPPQPGHPRARFPGFWETKMDYTPDNDHGANSANGLQSMLLQGDGERIYLLPAWPEDWDVSFKLHAPFNTTVQCVYRGGKVQSLTVTPQARAKDVIDMSSLANRVRTLVGVACADRNHLFGLPPMLDAQVAPQDAARLATTGPWLAKYPASVCGLRSGPFAPGPWGGSLFRDNIVYLHVLAWPEGGLRLTGLPLKVKSATVLTGGRAELTQDGDSLRVMVDAKERDAVDTIIQLELDGSAEPLVRRQPFAGSLTTGKKASASGSRSGCGPQNAVDADGKTLWQPAGPDPAWLEVDLGGPTAFQRVQLHLDQVPDTRGSATPFTLQVRDASGGWTSIHSGAVYGRIYSKGLEQPVTASAVRLVTSSPSAVVQFDLFRE